MSRLILKYTSLFIVMVLLQVIVFNHLCLFNIATPFVFIYFIFLIPISLNFNWTVTLSFLIGLIIDIFSDTQGMNALACTILSVTRHPIFRLYIQHEDDNDSLIPSISNIGLVAFIKYALTLTITYCILINIIQSLSFFDIKLLIFRIIGSSIISFLLILGIAFITNFGSAKRL